VTVDTDKDVVVVHDGSTAGGIPLAKEASVLPLAGGTMTGTIAGFTSTGIDDNATSTAITIDASENVGIGTASPSYQLDTYSGTADIARFSGNIMGQAELHIRNNVGANNGRGCKISIEAGNADVLGQISAVHSGTTADSSINLSVEQDNVLTNYVQLDGNNQAVIFRPTGTEKMRINASGVDISAGNLKVDSGYGIDFSATSDGSGTMTSEVLDDYEEGTWTPTIEFGGASVGVSYSTNVGTYTKVGNLVKASCYVQMSSKGTSAGAARIQGLPFSVGSSANYTPAAVWLSNTSFADYPMFRVNSGETYFEIEEITNAGVRSVLTHANYADNSAFMLGVTYNV
jgi:hypothetical protein